MASVSLSRRLRTWLPLLLLPLMLGACAVLDRSRPGYEQTFPARAAASSGPSLHFTETGSGEPILLIHGLGLNTHSWRQLIGPLSRQHRVIALDLKGHGDSPKPDDGEYSLYDQARLVHRFIIDHDLRRLTLIGHSYGGGVALVTALRLNTDEPDRLTRLALIDAMAYEQELPLFVRLMATPVLGPLLIHLIPAQVQMQAIMELTFERDELIEDADVVVYADYLNRPGMKTALLATARQILPSDLETVTGRYADIGQTALVLWGRQDEIVPLDNGRRLAAALPRARLVVLDKTGHAPQEERPVETLDAIEAFLREP